MECWCILHHVGYWCVSALMRMHPSGWPDRRGRHRPETRWSSGAWHGPPRRSASA